MVLEYMSINIVVESKISMLRLSATCELVNTVPLRIDSLPHIKSHTVSFSTSSCTQHHGSQVMGPSSFLSHTPPSSPSPSSFSHSSLSLHTTHHAPPSSRFRLRHRSRPKHATNSVFR